MIIEGTAVIQGIIFHRRREERAQNGKNLRGIYKREWISDMQKSFEIEVE